MPHCRGSRGYHSNPSIIPGSRERNDPQREVAPRRLKEPSTSFGGIQLTQRGDRPGRFDLTTDEAAELHVSLKVIRQGCEQHLTGYFRSGAASELSQPAFAFDPSVRKLRHSCALAIDLLGMGSAHPFLKPSHWQQVLRDGDSASGLFQFTDRGRVARYSE